MYGRALNTWLQRDSEQVLRHYVHGAPRNVMAGMGLCYAIQNENYLHIPIIAIFPSAYAGYHVYKNKDSIVSWINLHKQMTN